MDFLEKFVLGRGDVGVKMDCGDMDLCEPSAALREFLWRDGCYAEGGVVGWY